MTKSQWPILEAVNPGFIGHWGLDIGHLNKIADDFAVLLWEEPVLLAFAHQQDTIPRNPKLLFAFGKFQDNPIVVELDKFAADSLVAV
jgi:hypothetical protein